MSFEINLTTEASIRNIKRLNRNIDKTDAKLAKVNSRNIHLAKVGASARQLQADAGMGAAGFQNLGRASAQLKAQVATVQTQLTDLHKNGFLNVKKGAAGANKNLKEFRETMATTSKRAAGLRAAMYATGTHFGAFTAQTILTATAVYALVKSFAAIIAVGAEFSASMARANAVMGNFDAQGNLVTERADLLESKVRHLGETTVFTVNEVAQGLVFLGMAGLDTAEAAKALEPVLNLSSIGMIEMARAADIATNVMLGFDQTAGDLTDIVNVMATAVISSNMNMEQLGNSLSYVAPIAESTNNSLRDTVAILEVFHDVGIKSSRAGTSLRRALVNLSKPTEKMNEVLVRLGISLKDQAGGARPLIEVMRQLRDANADVSDILTLFGARAGPAMIKLYKDLQKEVNGSTSAFQKHRDELDSQSNAAESLREKIEDVLGADWKKLVSALSELALSIYDDLEPSLRSLVQSVTEFIKSVRPESIYTFIEALTALMAIKYALVPLLLGSFTRMKMFAAATTAAGISTRFLATGLKLLAGPAGWLVLGITALAAFTHRQKESTTAAELHALSMKTDGERIEELTVKQKAFNELTKESQELQSRALRSEYRGKVRELLSEKTELNRLKNALDKRAQQYAELEARTSAGVNAAELLNLKASITRLSERLKLKAEDVSLTEKQLKLLKEERDILAGKSEITKPVASEESKKAIQAMVKSAVGGTPVGYQATISAEKELTSQLANRLEIQKQLNKITSVEAAVTIKKRLTEESRVVNSLLDEQISKQAKLEEQAVSSVLLASKTKDKEATERATKVLEKERAALEKLVKVKTDYKKATDKQVSAASTLIAKVGTSLMATYATELEAERSKHADNLAMIADYYSTLEGKQKDHNEMLEREESRHQDAMLQSFNNQAQQVLSGLSSLVGAMVGASSARYKMAQEDAQSAWTLYEESVSRQGQFQDAANAAQTAGDQQYYQNLASQYENYSATYQQQAQEYDRIAERRFEQNKKMQEAQTIINTASGAMMAIGQFGYWGIPIAAAILDQGQQMVSLIRSQEYQSPGGGGFGGAFGGLPASPDGSESSNISAPPQTDGQTNSLQIFIEGAVTEEMVYDLIIPAIQDGISERDIVLISGTGADSAQLSELAGTP